MDDEGWIVIKRAIINHPLFRERPDLLGAFTWMICAAHWRSTKLRIGGQVVTLERGQLSHSIRYMAKAWGWEKTRVERFLNLLKTETMIETETATGQTVITLCNYAKHQDQPDESATASATVAETAPRQHRDKERTIEQSNNKKEGSLRSPSHGTRLPDDYTLNEIDTAFANNHGFSGNALKRVFDGFCDYWHSRAGAGGRKVDWHATWRNWIRREASDRGGSHGRTPQRPGGVSAAVDKIIRDLGGDPDQDADGRLPPRRLPRS